MDEISPALFLTAPSNTSFLTDGSVSIEKWFNASNDGMILQVRRIARCRGGSYSQVWKAEMIRDGNLCPVCDRQTCTVALKVLLPTDTSERLMKRKQREMVWTSLNHDHVAPLCAIYHQADGLPVFVSHWCENGTTNQYLRQHPAVDPMPIIREIALAIEYLHARGVVHGDLKANNVLIDDHGHARLIDFGLSHLIDGEPGLDTLNTTTLRWCARELLCSDDAFPTTASDVYAFASTTLELLTGHIPYHMHGDRTVYRLVVHEGVSPRASSGPFLYHISGSDLLWEVLESCWAEAPFRPTMAVVRSRLSSIGSS